MKNLLLFIAILATLPIYAQEICGNGIDDDGDQLVDCADPQCLSSPDCENAIPCNEVSDFYIFFGGDTVQLFNQQTTSFDFVYDNADELNLNAAGYNSEDGLIYGINIGSNDLIVVGANGVYSTPIDVAGLTNNNYIAGDFDANGNLVVMTGVPQNTIDVIDVSADLSQTSSVQTYTIAGVIIGGLADITYSAYDGNFYGLNHIGNLYQINFNQSTSQANVVRIPVIYSNGFTTCGSWIGAAVSTQTGFLYFFCNNGGEIWEIDITDPNNVIGSELLTINLPGQLDGAACPFADEFIPVDDEGDCFEEISFEPSEVDCDTYTFTPTVITSDGVEVLGYHWDFGDGNVVVSDNPTFDFPANGDYEVSLTVIGVNLETGECCCETFTDIITVNCGCEAIQAEFTYEEIDCNSFEFNTTALPNVGTTPFVYYWDFGDGNTSTDVNPTHDYTNDGTYTVSLTVTGIEFDSGDCCCFEMEETITVDCSGDTPKCGEILDISSRVGRGGNPAIFSIPNNAITIQSGWGSPSYLWSFVCTATGAFQTFASTTAVVDLTNCIPKEGTISVVVSLTNANGEKCEISFSESFVHIGGTLGGGQLRLSPNPTSNNVTIDFSSTEVAEGAIISISVKANDGREIKAIEMANGETKTIDISGMVDGTYMVSVLKGGEVLATEKLVIQKQY